MRIVSWNVNGLQTTLKDATHRYTNTSIYFTTVLHADVVCFQEAKVQEDKLEKWMACVPGFESFWAFSQAKKGYSGVVTYVKDDLSPLDAAAEKLPLCDTADAEDLCQEGRIVETDHGSFVLVNVYVPNAGDRGEGRPRLDFKIRFLQALKTKCDDLVRSGRHVVVVGDFNIAHKANDLHTKWNVEEVYSSEERGWLDDFLTEYVDLFRHFHPDVKDVFSVWETRTDARIHNEGLRIDYAVCDKDFLPQVKEAQILKMVPKNWSDHAAVVLTLMDQPALPHHPAPAISSRNMKRFQEDRRQKKLTALFSRGAPKPVGVNKVERKFATAFPQADEEDGVASGNYSSPDTAAGNEAGKRPDKSQPGPGDLDERKVKELVALQGEPITLRQCEANGEDSQAQDGDGGGDGGGGGCVEQDPISVHKILESVDTLESVENEEGIAPCSATNSEVESVENLDAHLPPIEVKAVDAFEKGNAEDTPLKRKRLATVKTKSGNASAPEKQRTVTAFFKAAPRESGSQGEE